jgi:hypothetical protein
MLMSTLSTAASAPKRRETPVRRRAGEFSVFSFQFSVE